MTEEALDVRGPESLLDQLLPQSTSVRFTGSDPGCATAAIAFTVLRERQGTRVKTETRVVGTSGRGNVAVPPLLARDRSCKRCIRRSWLAAIRRHAPRALATTSERM